MARKRLRPLLEEVIGDADLRASAARVTAPAEPSATAEAASGGEPAAPSPDVEARGHAAQVASVVTPPDAVPPPPWDAPPPVVVPVPPRDGQPDADTDGTPMVASRPAEPAAVIEVAVGAAAAIDVPAAVIPGGAEVSEPTPGGPAAAVVLAAADAGQVARRRRRSASLLPPLPSPTDIPEDAAGRIEILSVPPPLNSTPVAPLTSKPAVPAATGVAATQGRQDSDSAPGPVTAVGGSAALAGWLPVIALGLVLVVLFVVGVLVTR